MRRVTLGMLVGLAILTSAADAVHAQEFEPRTYAVAPVNLNFIGIGYAFASGKVFIDPSLLGLASMGLATGLVVHSRTTARSRRIGRRWA